MRRSRVARLYKRHTCAICNRKVSDAGYAKVSHYRAHVRRGEAIEEDTRTGFRYRKNPKQQDLI